jgi:hypothetical protein
MSLSTCLQGVSPAIASKLLDDWSALVASGMSESDADRRVLSDYATELNDRLNTVKKAAGVPVGKLINLARTPAQINKEADAMLKKLAPKRKVVEHPAEEILLPIEEQEESYLIDLRYGGIADPADYTNHSGGAGGADEHWHTIPKKLGYATKDVHYREPGQSTVDSVTLKAQGVTAQPISEELYAKGKIVADKIDAILGENPNRGYGHYRYRNYAQVHYADAVFAISAGFTIRNGRNAPKDRGTIYAIYGAIIDGKPVYVFDQKAAQWKTWDYANKVWVDIETPVLTRNFAGIGTRTLLDAGRKAIADVFQKTFGGSAQNPIEQMSGTPIIPGTGGHPTYTGNITSLADNQVFVFGANDQGLHGKGSAAVAMGEERDLKAIKALRNGTQGKWTVKGEHSKITTGTEGKSYPLVTVTGEIGNKTVANRMDRNAVLTNIEQLYKTAAENPQLQFLIGYQAYNNEAGLSGYTPTEIADMFAAFSIPENIVFETSMAAKMANVPRVFLGGLTLADQSVREPISINQPMIEQARAEQFIEIKDAAGKGTGTYFSADQQIQATNSVIYQVSALINQKGKLSEAELKRAIRQKFEDLLNKAFTPMANGQRVLVDREDPSTDVFPQITQEMAAGYKDNMINVLNSFDDIVKDSLNRLKVYGIKVREIDSTGATELEVQEGKGLENFHDLIFTLDPRDTASGRLKLFMSTIEEVKEGTKLRPKTVKVPMEEMYRDKIVRGEKYTSFRTPEQLDSMRLSVKQGNDTGTVKFGDQWYKVVAHHKMSAQEAEEYNGSPEGEAQQAKAGDILLQFTPYVEEQGLLPINSFIGVPVIADFESLFEDVTGQLADRKSSFENYLQVLRGSNKLVLRRLAEKLASDKTPDQIKKEFVSVMTKAYTEYGVVLYSMGKRGVTVNTINANAYSIRKTLISKWKEQQKLSPIMTRDKAGNFMMAPERITELRNAYEVLKALEAKFKAQVVTSKQAQLDLAAYNVAAEKLVDTMFTLNGIVLEDAAYKDLFTNLQEYTGTTGNMMSQWAVNADGIPNGMFSKFLLKLIQEKEGDDIENSLEKNNPLYTEGSTMNILAKVYMRHADILYNSSHRNLNGDNIWDYTLNTYLTHAWDELTGEDGGYRAQLMRTDFAKHNWLLKHWREKKEDMGKASIEYLEGLKKKYGKAAAERDAMSDRDQLFTALAMYTNNGRNLANYLGMTHSDKTRTPIFRNLPRTKVMTGDKVSPQLMERLYSVFESEFDRIVSSSSKKYDSVQYEAGKKYFFMLPQFNYDNMVELVKQGHITEEELAMVWVAPGVINPGGKSLDLFPKLVESMLNDFIEQETTLQLQEFEDTGMVNYKDGTHLFEQKYVDRYVARHRSIKQTKQGWQDSSSGVNHISQEEYTRKLARFMAMDYAMNSFLVNTSLIQLMYGDPAQAFKKTVEGTMIEYQKRLAGPIAPGKETEWLTPYYKTIALSDWEVSLDYIKDIPAYKKTNVTDAQEFVTMEEHLMVMRQYGQIAEKTYTEMMEIVNKGGYYEFEDPAHLKVVLQITKPVYYGKKIEKDGAILHDYVKSSAIPLYPPFTRGKEIDHLRRTMEDSGIARAHFISARKLGSPEPTTVFDAAGKFTPPDLSKVETVSRDGFRIQQEVPHDPYKKELLTASQANKIVVADLPEGIEITLRSGQKLDRKSVRELKESLRKQMVHNSLQDFMVEMGVTQEANGLYTFADKKKLLDRLIKEGKEKNYSQNELQPFTHLVDGLPISPMYFTSLADPMEGLMMSMVDKVVKLKVPGKSYVQASSVGLTKMLSSTDGIDGITWLPGNDPGAQLRMPELIDGKVSPAGILVPFHFFAGDAKLKLQSFLKEDGTVDLEKLDPAALELVGIRIPTSKHNSMLPMRIAGFLPENMGDTIIVPPGITVQMGSDFDVDKLFVYQRPYTGTVETGLKPDEGIYADYFDIHYQVLTHPAMYRTMMSPLDKSDLKDEAALASRQKKPGNALTGRAQRADFISQKDAKNLVGYSALTNTFLAGIQEMDLFVGQPVVEDGKIVRWDPDPVKAFGGLELYKLSGYGHSDYKGEYRSKMDNIGIMMSEFLDHAKHRTVDKINLTVHTYGAAAALMSLENGFGQSLDLTYAARLIQQEYIVKFNEKMSRGEDMLSAYTPNLKESIFDELEKELIKKGASQEQAAAMEFDSDQLLALLGKKTDPTAQLALLQAFRVLDGIGTRMSEMSSLLNQDVNGTGGSLFNVMDKIGKKDTVLGNNIIVNGQQMYEQNETLTEKGAIAETVNGLANDLFDSFLPHKQIFSSVLAQVMEITGRTSMTQVSMDVKKSVLKSLRSFVYSGNLVALGVEDVTAERARLLYSTAAGPSLAQRVVDAQNTWGKNNYFIKRLATVIGDGVEPHAVNFIASKVTRMDDNENVRAFLDLLMSSDKERKLLGEDLVRYAFLTGGQQDANSFVRYVPFGYLASTGWYDGLRTAYTNLDAYLKNSVYLDQWFRHNPERAIQITEGFKELGYPIKGIPEELKFPHPSPENQTAADKKFMVRAAENNGQLTYTTYLSYRTPEGQHILYRKTTPGNGDIATGVKYIRVDTLGNAITDEFNSTEAMPRSMIAINRTANTAWNQARLPVTGPTVVTDDQTAIQEPEPDIDYGTDVPPLYTLILKLNSLDTSEEELRERVIPELLASGELPGVYHTLLEQIGKMTMSPIHQEIIDALRVSLAGPTTDTHPSLHILITPKTEGSLGLYELPDNTIQFSPTPRDHVPVQEDPRNLQEVLIHELFHWTTSPYLEVAKKQSEDGWGNSEIGDVAEKIVDPKGELMRSATALYKIYEQVKETLYRTDVSNRVNYAISNVHEFVVMATTNKEFMQVLNNMPTKNNSKTMLEHVWDLLNTLFNNIAEFLGQPVKHNSVLAEALPHLVILQTHQKGISILSTDVVKYDGIDVVVGINDSGEAVKVREDFMLGEPEPRRQEEISRILSMYNAYKDVDAVTEEPFRGPDVVETIPDTDKKYELFPNVFANEMQRKAIDTIPEHIRSARGSFADRSFVLSGAGGTGKTTIIRKIMEQFPDKVVAFAAPSHNAVVELKSALTSKMIRDNGWSVNTLQSELRLRKNIEKSDQQGKEVFERVPPKDDDRFPRRVEVADVVVIDESSMVDDDLIGYLQEAVREHTIVIFMGDYAQLTPVGQQQDAWPFREVMPKRGVRLVENMRTSKADVAAFLNLYREDIDKVRAGQKEYTLPVVPYAKRANSTNVTLLRKPSQLTAEYVKQFKLDPKNPKNALIITYRNNTRLALNKEVRNQLFGAEAAVSKYVKGDLIIFNQATKPATKEGIKVMEDVFGTPAMFNMQRVIVESFEEGFDLTVQMVLDDFNKLTVTLPGQRMSVNLGPDANHFVLPIEAFSKEAVNGLINEVKSIPYDKALRGYNLAGHPNLEKIFGSRTLGYGRWLNFRSALQTYSLDVDYAYAVTSHKSQGSTYNHTFVDELDISSVSMANRKDLVHSLYTAVSRTREHLYIYHPSQPETKVPDASLSLNAASATIANNSNGPWNFRNEQEAKNAETKTNQLFPNVPVNRVGTGLSFGFPSMTAEAATERRKLEPKVSKVIDQLQAQLKAIRASMGGNIPSKLKAEKRLQLKKIEDDIADLKMHNNLAAISLVGKRQMEWIKRTADRTHPTPTEIMAAWRVTDVWANIFDTLYGDLNTQGLPASEDPELNKVSADAVKLRHSLLSNKMVPAMIALSEGRLEPMDFTRSLKDMTGFASLALSLNRASSELVQEIDLLLKNAGRRTEQDSKKLIHRLERLEKKVEAMGMPRQQVYSKMIQTNDEGTAFGLVQPYTADWFSKSARLRYKRTDTMKALAASATKESAAKAAKQIWTKFWKDIKAIGVYADVTKLFDAEGNYLADISAERTRLIYALGTDPVAADKMIADAQKAYHNYLEDRDTYFDSAEQKFHEGTITEIEAQAEKDAFEERNSPVKFFNDMAANAVSNQGDKYAVLRPLASRGEFYDADYTAIQLSPQLKEVYDEFETILKESRAMLPAYVQKTMHDNFLPVVALNLVTDISNRKEYLQAMGKNVLDSLTGTEYEKERQDADSIPIRFTQKWDGKKAISHDLVRITELFGMMALHYRHFAQIKDAVDMGEMILKETDRMRRADPGSGEVLTNTLKTLKYAKEYMMFKNARKLEGDTGMTMYSLNPLTQKKIAGKVKDLLSQRFALEQQLMDPPEGKSVLDINTEIDAINVQLTAIEGQNIYLSKVGDRLIGINQLKALAFNPFSGFANLSFGMVSLLTYSNGKRDFTMKEALKAMGMMTNSTRKWLTFGAGNNPVAEKVMALMERTGMMGDIVDSQYGESNLKGRKNKFRKHIDPYAFLRSSDYYMKGSVLIATMLHTEVEVVENGQTRKVPLWEAFDEQGKWKYENKEGWEDENSAREDKWEKFRNRTIRVSQIVMGNMDKNSPKLMNKHILGRLIGQFRASWLPEGWAARFEDEKEDVQLGRVIKGRYRTYADIGLSGSTTILIRQFLGMFSNSNYFDGITRKDGVPVSSSEVDMENMRRNYTGMMWTLSLMGAVMAIKALMPDDDDDEIGAEALMIALNLVNRVNQDLQFYSSPDVANNLVRNAIPAFDVVNDYIKAVKATKKAILSEDYDWDEAALKWTKATPFLNQINRVKFMTEHDISEISR